MSTFQERFSGAFDAEVRRRRDAGEPPLTKTMVWKAAGSTSGAFTQWYIGPTTATLDRCLKMAPLLRVNGHWLFDGTGEQDATKEAAGASTAKEKRAPYSIDVSHASKRVRAIISRLIDHQDNEKMVGLVEHVLHVFEPDAHAISNAETRDGFHGNINASRINMGRQQQKPPKAGSV